MVDARETQIGILVYEGVNLLDVAVPYELFGWAAATDSTLSVRLVAAKAGRGDEPATTSASRLTTRSTNAPNSMWSGLPEPTRSSSRKR